MATSSKLVLVNDASEDEDIDDVEIEDADDVNVNYSTDDDVDAIPDTEHLSQLPDVNQEGTSNPDTEVLVNETNCQLSNTEQTTEEEEAQFFNDSETIDPNSAQPDAAPKTRSTLVQLPISRVKAIIKADPDVHLVNQEAVQLIAKATELFIHQLVSDAADVTLRSKRKILQGKDLNLVIGQSGSMYEFLEGSLDW